MERVDTTRCVTRSVWPCAWVTLGEFGLHLKIARQPLPPLHYPDTYNYPFFRFVVRSSFLGIFSWENTMIRSLYLYMCCLIVVTNPIPTGGEKYKLPIAAPRHPRVVPRRFTNFTKIHEPTKKNHKSYLRDNFPLVRSVCLGTPLPFFSDKFSWPPFCRKYKTNSFYNPLFPLCINVAARPDLGNAKTNSDAGASRCCARGGQRTWIGPFLGSLVCFWCSWASKKLSSLWYFLKF